MEPTPLVSPDGPNAEFLSDRRIQILEALRGLINHEVPSLVWACLWLADIQILEEHLAAMTAATSAGQRANASAWVRVDYRPIIKNWSQRSRPASPATTPSKNTTPVTGASPLRQTASVSRGLLTAADADRDVEKPPSSPTTPPRPAKRPRLGSFGRSKAAIDECRARDGNRCVVTKYYDPIDVAHIYPYSMRDVSKDNTSLKTDFWGLLALFWTEERIARWHSAIFSTPKGTETVSNLICFAPHIHRWHAKSLFGLQPIKISEDERQLTVKFYWLPQRQYAERVCVDEAPTIPSDLQGLENKFKAWDVITEEKIKSGQEIVIQTDDPENRPLPSMELLDFQWTLQRLSAISGAAEVLDDSPDDTGSSGIGWEEDLYAEPEEDVEFDVQEEDDLMLDLQAPPHPP